MGSSINKDFVSLEMLKEQIESVRDRMHRLWTEKGHTNHQVLIASLELDLLINEYQRRIGV